MKKYLILVLVSIVGVSCVTTQKYNAAKAYGMRLESDNAMTNSRIDELTTRNDKLTSQHSQLIGDTARLGAEYRMLSGRYAKLLADGSAEAGRMLRELEASQTRLNERERNVAELQQQLDARERAIAQIRKIVSDALLGFEGKGLTITTRDGKVYVSMDDKLLFKSGSFDIDPAGAQAVRDLSRVLAQNTDIVVMVEGHTDDVPYPANGQLRDNLDLSAKRATTVVRLLLENKGVEPSRIIAAGRGESLPLFKDKSAASRQKNRRTEIILTPKLDALMQVMEPAGAKF